MVDLFSCQQSRHSSVEHLSVQYLEEVVGWAAPQLSDCDSRLLVLPIRVKNKHILSTVAVEMLWIACSIGAISVFIGAVYHESPARWKELEPKRVWMNFENDLSRLDAGHKGNTASSC